MRRRDRSLPTLKASSSWDKDFFASGESCVCTCWARSGVVDEIRRVRDLATVIMGDVVVLGVVNGVELGREERVNENKERERERRPEVEEPASLRMGIEG